MVDGVPYCQQVNISLMEGKKAVGSFVSGPRPLAKADGQYVPTN
jgi:hypothetical protein